MSACILIFSIALALIVAGAPPAARARNGAPKAPEVQRASDSILVEEDVLIAFMDEPSQRFYKAHEYLLKKDRKASADEIRVIAAFLSLNVAAAADKTDRGRLNTASSELVELAQGVENGAITSVLDLDPAFTDAYGALAIHHYRKAREAWQRRQVVKTGRHLKASTQYLEKEAVSAGRKLNIESIVTFEEARMLSEKLIKGDAWMPKEVGRRMEAIGKEIEKLSGKMAKP